MVIEICIKHSGVQLERTLLIYIYIYIYIIIVSILPIIVTGLFAFACCVYNVSRGGLGE
jgi:hypothetical protein